MKENQFISWNEDKDYTFTRGGLLYTILQKAGIVPKEGKIKLRKILILAIVLWIPLIIITWLENTLTADTVTINLFEDLAIHIRVLLVIPFLILIENVIEPSYDIFVNSTRRIIQTDQKKIFDRQIDQTEKLSNSWIPEILFLCMIYMVYFSGFVQAEAKISNWGVIEINGEIDHNIAGNYYVLFILPIYQFLLARWFWRWIIWSYSVIRFSRLDLNIDAAHADQMAGLEYMTLVPKSFVFLFISVATMFSSMIAMDMIYYCASLEEYYFPVLFFVVSVPIVIFAPLLVFIPKLVQSRANAIARFGSLIQYHNILFRRKWLEVNLPEEEQILPSLDNSSLADLNGAYQQSVKEMNIIPINRSDIISSMVILLVPFFPLLLFKYSFKDLISKLLSAIGG